MQQFQVFQGLPEDLVLRLIALRTATATLISVVPSHVSAKYIIFYTAAAPIP
jgi:hypothetical protein